MHGKNAKKALAKAPLDKLGLAVWERPPSPFDMSQRSPFRHFKTSPGIIRLAVMLYVRFPLSLRSVER